MGISSYKKDGKTLYRVSVSCRDPDGARIQRQQSNIANKSEANRVLRSLQKQCDEELFSRSNKQSPWGELVDQWEVTIRSQEGASLAPANVVDRANTLRMYTSEWWYIPADQINQNDVWDVFYAMDAEGKSHSRKKEVRTGINAVFNWAIATGKLKNISVSPAQFIKFKKKAESKPEILNVSEMRQLLRVAKEVDHPWYPVWAMALLTGMRYGELMALNFSDVDFKNKIINVTKSFSSRTKVIKSTKAGYWRIVPINDELIEVLRELQLSADGRKEVLPRLPRWRNGEAARILKEFSVGYGLPAIKFHTLRACFATQLIRNGVAPGKVMAICGWKGLKTMQFYIRLAGIEVDGATKELCLLPSSSDLANVRPLHAVEGE